MAAARWWEEAPDYKLSGATVEGRGEVTAEIRSPVMKAATGALSRQLQRSCPYLKQISHFSLFLLPRGPPGPRPPRLPPPRLGLFVPC